MPYIKKHQRKHLNAGGRPEEPGDLAYQLAVLVDDYVHTHGLSYDVICDVRGGLLGVLGEWDRKVAYRYEDFKADVNGEVFIESLRALRAKTGGLQ